MINLTKGSSIDLKKSTTLNDSSENDLSKITIGLGWDIRKKSGFASIFSLSSNEEYDLDACALLLQNDNLTNDKDIVFYGNKKHHSGNIWSCGDNLTGGSNGDDEQIVVNLANLDKKYNKVIFYVSIYKAKSKNQNFSMIKNAYIRAINKKNIEIARFNMSGDSSLKDKCSYVFAQAVRDNDNDSWRFDIIGEAYDTDKYSDIAKLYI